MGRLQGKHEAAAALAPGAPRLCWRGRNGEQDLGAFLAWGSPCWMAELTSPLRGAESMPRSPGSFALCNSLIQSILWRREVNSDKVTWMLKVKPRGMGS